MGLEDCYVIFVLPIVLLAAPVICILSLMFDVDEDGLVGEIDDVETCKDKVMDINQMSATEVADALAEYQRWRRSEGEYDWSHDFDITPPKGCPFSPKELGIIEDQAIAYLRGIDKR